MFTVPTLSCVFCLPFAFQQLAFARDVAAVTFCRHILAEGADGFARDNFSADGRLMAT